jgi:DNA repair exonuclease SbcCD nuclease subunit
MLVPPNQPYWIILADTQLGYIHWQNPEREVDFYIAFQEQCLKAAEDNNCLGIIGLGDLRERTTIQAKSLGGMNRGLKILADSNKCLLALMGNHDKTEPSWIKEMHYPSLKDLTNPRVQIKHGFDPDKTLALHFTNRSQLKPALESKKPEEKQVVFLHQSLKEMTTNMLQSYDISIEDFSTLGFGKTQHCTVFMGDLHNYGDTRCENLEVVYPGSLEMTDINEGINGLRSQRISSGPHDYRKFVIHYYPNLNQWSPIELNPRPWLRGKAKTNKEAIALESLLRNKLSQWENKGCLHISVPKGLIDSFQNLLKDYPILEARIDQYDPLSDEESSKDISTTLEHSLSWKENKNKLLEIAQSTGIDNDSYQLLDLLCQTDGANHNTKTDVMDAWSKWFNPTPQDNNKPTEEVVGTTRGLIR